MSIVFSSDGTLIGSASRDQTIRVWSTASGTELVPALHGHEDIVRDVAFSPDGCRIVSGSNDKTVRIWDALWIGGQLLPALVGHLKCVSSVAFSPNGNFLVSGSSDIRIWDAMSGAQHLTLEEQPQDFYTLVAFSPDGTLIVSSGFHNKVQVWVAESGNQLFSMSRLDYALHVSAQMSPHTIHVVDNGWVVHSPTGRIISKLPDFIRENDTSISAHDRSLAIGSGGQLIIIHFPLDVFTSSETRPECRGREIWWVDPYHLHRSGKASIRHASGCSLGGEVREVSQACTVCREDLTHSF